MYLNIKNRTITNEEEASKCYLTFYGNFYIWVKNLTFKER